MSTPAFLPSVVSATVIDFNSGSIRCATKGPDGTPINVSSGYTLDHVTAEPYTGTANPGGAVTVTTNFSAAFDSSGFNLNYTAAQADALFLALKANVSRLFVWISNDGGTTKSVGQVVLLTLDMLSIGM